MYQSNNYGYNPYGTYMPQRPIQQPIEQQTNNIYKLNGKQVESIEAAKVIDFPLDGSTSYFATIDGSAIVTKQLLNDGTIKTTIFKPSNEQNKEIQYVTPEDMKKAINDIDLSDFDDIKDELKELKQELKELKKKKKDD